MLATEGWQGFKRQYFGDDRDKMDRAAELRRLLDAGLIGYEEAVREIAAMAGVPAVQLDKTFRNVAANDELLDYIRDHLKSRYTIALLSNTGDDRLYSLFTAEQRQLFDSAQLSHEVGVVKPDPRAYEAMAQKLGVAAEQCIFVDDLERNIAGARDVGMQAIQYKDFEQFRSELEQLLADSKH